MKKLLASLVIAIVMTACQSEKGKQSSEMVEMAEQKLEYFRQYGDDAQAKMILKYGEAKVRWYDSMTVARDMEDSIKAAKDQAKIDSVNKILESK